MLDLSIMLVEDITALEETVKLIVLDMKRGNIYSFGDWLIEYEETIEEVESFVNAYCDKVLHNKLNNIENWEKVVMMNAIALYMIEMDINDVPIGNTMINKLLAIYVETIRYYKLKKHGKLKLLGNVFISDITLHKFVKA